MTSAWLTRIRSDRRLRRGALALGGLASAGLLFAGARAGSQDSFAALAGQMLGRTALVLGLLFLALAGLKRWQGRAVRSRQLAALESLRLSPRQALHLVRFGERTLLLGAADGQITLLAEGPEALPETASAPHNPPAPASFAAALAQWGQDRPA